MKRLIGFLLCTFFASAFTSVTANVQQYQLDNGLKILVKEDHRAPVVVSQVWYKVGSSYEHDGITGISHALEHMMFKGTSKYPAGRFSEIISENGGQENAFTGTDYTAYFQTLEKSRLEISLQLEADRMRNLTLPNEEFLKEIKVVQEERRLRTEDNPRAFAREVAMATAFQTSPYRQPIVGWMEDLQSMTVEDLKSWYQLWYAPNNATLVVAGDVDSDEVFRLAKKYFGGLKTEEVASPRIASEVKQNGLKRVVIKRPAEVPHLQMSYKAPVLTTVLKGDGEVEPWEPYALEVLAGVLDGGSSARFASRLVRGREVASGVGAGYSLVSRLSSLFAISGSPAKGKTTAELEAAIKEEIDTIKQELVNAEELERVKAQVVSADVYEKDSVFYQALIIGMLETIGLPWTLADEYVGNIQKVTAEQVQAVAQKYLVDDSLTVAVLEPLPMEQARPRRALGGSRHAH